MKKAVLGILGIIVAVGTLYLDESFSFLSEDLFNENSIINDVVNDQSDVDIPAHSEEIFTIINDNIPYFEEEDKLSDTFEEYSELDSLGRVGVAFAMIDKSMMPTEDRESIGSVKPTGWHTVKYDIVSGNYLYNRSHLIGFQLTGENANEKNLMTGTRYFNVEGMLPFENMVADYITETGNKVLYRVTPVYDGNNLLASGATIEALSIEDDEISINVFIHNIQPGIVIEYATGESSLE